jgi:hypothetical protein
MSPAMTRLNDETDEKYQYAPEIKTKFISAMQVDLHPEKSFLFQTANFFVVLCCN